ncbi:ethionine resistance protein [Linderina macrospora]|uniref:Ethionine resistance protein n=1 Tax=Linderina macrospora TaxID=4868 RepID=A0ACC1J9Y0_9FUNG|nr:ethionine resistance protein [Linderina macrospora]
MTIVVGTATTLSFVLAREWWGNLYSSDPEVAQVVIDLMPVAGIFLTCNGLNQVFGAILRGLGRQKLGACIIVPSFNLIGLPLSLYFAYGPLDMKVVGLWWGTCVGTVISAVVQLYFIIYRTDWDKEVERCIRRLIVSRPAKPQMQPATQPETSSSITQETTHNYGTLA